MDKTSATIRQTSPNHFNVRTAHGIISGFITVEYAARFCEETGRYNWIVDSEE